MSEKKLTARNNQASIPFISEIPRFQDNMTHRSNQENLLKPGPGYYDTDAEPGQIQRQYKEKSR